MSVYRYKYYMGNDPELMGNPIVGALVAGGVGLAGLIVGAVQKKKQRKAESKAVSQAAKAQADAAAAAVAKKQEAQSNVLKYAAIGVPALAGILLLKKYVL